MIDLKNTNIILTGATGGIGSSILELLNKVNANIIASGTNTIKIEKLKEKNGSKEDIKKIKLIVEQNNTDAIRAFNKEIDDLTKIISRITKDVKE